MLAQGGGAATGLAGEFARQVSTAWDFFASYETAVPVVTFRFADGLGGAAGDPEDIPAALLHFIYRYFEVPHVGWLEFVAQPFQSDEFACRLALEGTDGPLRLRLSDESELVFSLDAPTPIERPLSRWDAGVQSGLVQQEIEAAIGLAHQIGLPALTGGDDRRVAEALLALLAELAKTENPPQSIVRSAVRWLGHKVDVFIEEAVKTGGKAAGAAGVGLVGYELHKHFPQLAHHLHELIELSGQG